MVGFGYRPRQTGLAGLVPPAEMLQRKAKLREHKTQLQSGMGMRGSPENSIGARALYLWQGNKDTLYRIHGTNEPWTIGQNVSSGCIRMTNDDVTVLYNRTPMGTKVQVLATAYNAFVASGIVAGQQPRSCCTRMPAEQRHTASSLPGIKLQK